MKRRTVPLGKQVADAEASIIAHRGRPYLDAIYRSKGIEGGKNDLMGMLERLGILNFELGKLSAPATILTSPNAAVPAKQDGGSAPPPHVTAPPSAAIPVAEASLAAKPNLETLSALAAQLWPDEVVET